MANRLVPDHRQHERTFLPLSAPAKLCWFVATLELGASGIGTLYPVALTPLTSLTLDQVEAGLSELEAGGYLRRDGAVMWLVANLLEQGLNRKNSNHRASVEAHLSSLYPLAPELVEEFRARHAIWMAGEDDPAATGQPSARGADGTAILSGYHPDTIGMVSEARRKGGREVGGGEDGGEGPTATAATQARTELVDLLPEAYEPDLDGLLARVPAQSHHSWLRSLLALASGLHPPGAGLPNAVPPASLGEAIRQFNTNGETNWKRFTGYVRDVLTPRSAPAAGGGGGRGAGNRTEQAAAAGRQTYETVLRVAGAMRDQAGIPEAATAGTAVTPLARRVAP